MPDRTSPPILQQSTVAAFYDRHGAKQDGAAWYEDPPLARLASELALGDATSVVELGCGTGRFAARLLDESLPADARYTAVDLSAEMIRLTADRLSRFGDRASVKQTAVLDFDLPDAAVDRVISAYMLDILSEDDIVAVFDRCHRWLKPGGLMGLVGLTEGESFIGRLVSGIWTRVHRMKPALVGGCRPLKQAPLLDPDRWQIEHRSVVRPWGIPSEVLVARRL